MTEEEQKEYRKKIEERVSALPNSELLKDALYLAMGDDWTGTYTKEGRIELDVMESELKRRLAAPTPEQSEADRWPTATELRAGWAAEYIIETKGEHYAALLLNALEDRL